MSVDINHLLKTQPFALRLFSLWFSFKADKLDLTHVRQSEVFTHLMKLNSQVGPSLLFLLFLLSDSYLRTKNTQIIRFKFI